MLGIEWIGKILETVGGLVPRIIHCKETHRGILFKFGKCREINPGILIYLPIWSEPVLYPIKRQTVNLPPQFLTLREGDRNKTVVVSVAVVYDISDVKAALVDSYDVEDTVRDVAQGAVKKTLIGMDYQSAIESQEEIDEVLTENIKTVLEKYGCRVEAAFISDMSEARVYRVVGDVSQLTNL